MHKLIARAAIPRENTVAKLIAPRRYDLLDFGLEIGLGRVLQVAVPAPDNIMNAHRRTFGEKGRRGFEMPVERLFQHLLDCETHLRIVTLARNVDKNRDETPELVAPHERAGPGREIDLEDFLGNACELVRRYLEKLIPGERLKDIQQGSAGMTFVWEARTAQHFCHFLAQKGHIPCRKIMSGRCEKPCNEKAPRDTPARAVKLDTDRIHMDTVVDSGLAVGLDDDDRGRVQEKGASWRREAMRIPAVAQNRDGLVAQKPKLQFRPWNKLSVLLVP